MLPGLQGNNVGGNHATFKTGASRHGQACLCGGCSNGSLQPRFSSNTPTSKPIDLPRTNATLGYALSGGQNQFQALNDTFPGGQRATEEFHHKVHHGLDGYGVTPGTAALGETPENLAHIGSPGLFESSVRLTELHKQARQDYANALAASVSSGQMTPDRAKSELDLFDSEWDHTFTLGQYAHKKGIEEIAGARSDIHTLAQA